MADVAAQAPRLPAGEAPIAFSFRIPFPPIYVLLALGLAVRLALAFIDGFGVDIGTFKAWSLQIAAEGPGDFYTDDRFTDYAPGYMYVLWLIGELHEIFTFTESQFNYVLKLPSIVADLGSAWLLYLLLKQERALLRYGVPAIYLFFPPALFIGALWGQVDSILSFFLLLSVYFIGRDRPVLGAVAYTIGFLVKPQAIAALPVLAFWILREQWSRWQDPATREAAQRTVALCTAVPLLVLLALITPFFEAKPWELIGELRDAVSVYPNNSFWAYNFWNTGGLFEMGFRCDLASDCPENDARGATEFLGIATRWWGLFLFGVAIVWIVWTLRKAQGTGFLALGVGLSVLAFYVLWTRMHERYVFPAFLPLLLGCALLHSRVLWGVFVTASAVHFLNLYHVFGYYYFFAPDQADNYPGWLRWDGLFDWAQAGDFLRPNRTDPNTFTELPIVGSLETVQVMSILMVATLLAGCAWAFVVAERRGRAPTPT